MPSRFVAVPMGATGIAIRVLEEESMPLSREKFKAEAQQRAQQIAFEHDWAEHSTSRRELAHLIQTAIVELAEAYWPAWAKEPEEEAS